jgi:hypothetical protein
VSASQLAHIFGTRSASAKRSSDLNSPCNSNTVGLESTKRESMIAVKQEQFINKGSGSAGRVRKQDSALRHASHVT